MLEMTGGNFKFNSKVAYVVNQRNPLSGGYVEKSLGQKCQHEVSFKKNPYDKIVKPVLDRLDQFSGKRADLIVFAEQYSKLVSMIESVKNYVEGVNNIYIIYDSGKLHENDISAIRNIFFDIDFTFLNFEKEDSIKNSFMSFLLRLEDYIVFMKDSYSVKDTISIPASIIELERTFAHGFYFGLSLGDFVRNKVSCQWIKKDLYAWKYLCDENNKLDSIVLKMVLLRKKDVIKSLLGNKKDACGKIKNLLEHISVDSKKVGLFLEESKTEDFSY